LDGPVDAVGKRGRYTAGCGYFDRIIVAMKDRPARTFREVTPL
jgi:hypothetical protein